MRRYYPLRWVLLLSVLSGHAQEGFPRLGIGTPDIVLERATDLQVSLRESLRLFENSIKTESDPRAILCYTRTLLITLTAFRTDLMIRYADREHAPVQPKITEVEAQQLRSFIFQIMLLQAELLAFEETVLHRVSQQHQRAGSRWNPQAMERLYTAWSKTISRTLRTNWACSNSIPYDTVGERGISWYRS
jgi:hypothetical protein